MQDKVYSLLGIATKAGKTRSGAFQVQEALGRNQAQLVMISADAGDNTVHDIEPKCTAKGIPLRFYGTKDDLGHAMGKERRSCLAITDQGLAQAILRALPAQATDTASGHEEQSSIIESTGTADTLR